MERADIMEKVASFPSMPGAAAKVLRLLDDPNATSAQVGELLRYDPGLTANILRLTNSAYFGIPSKVSSVNQAVGLLGWKRLREMVTASCVNALMDREIPGYELPPGQLWQHSIAVSVTAESMSKKLGLPEESEVFTAALLHDVGKIVLGGFVEDELGAIEEIISDGSAFESGEKRVFGTDHAEVGARILKSWSFPSEVTEAVRWHHDPDSAQQSNPVTDIVHVANVLCLMMGIGVGREGLQYEPSSSSTKRLGIKARELEYIASQTLQWVNELSEILELEENHAA
jgi:putative nucleotidyltransferase with HDIG domain